MTDLSETLARYRLPLSRDRVRRARTYLAPFLRYAPRNSMMLVGVLLVGVGGILAWRNRETIARTASPIIDEARLKGHALIDEALSKGHELMEEAMAASAAIGAKANGRHQGDAGRDAVSNVY